MLRGSDYLPHAVRAETRSDGVVFLRSAHALVPVAKKTGDWLHRWAGAAPDRVFLAERSGADWRRVSYREALQIVRRLASSLLARGMGPRTPILVMSGNAVDHGLLSLAAQYAGIPIAPLAEQYSLIHGAHSRLSHAARLIRPSMAYVSDAGQFAEALALDALAGVEVVASRPGTSGATPFAALTRGDDAVDLDRARASVTPDTMGKILLTSGSTGSPKGVLTTQRMMCVNQAQLATVLPFLAHRPPVLVDWLPWNHVFGGSHNFNMVLANGGSLYIDDGKPLPGLIDRTVENLASVAGTVSFNVPSGFGKMVEALRRDAGLRKTYFQRLDMIFYAGASLPQETWKALAGMAMEAKGELPLITTSWGLTETAPSAMLQHQPVDHAGVVGVPLPEVLVKLIPEADGRYEVRVAGPNVTPGYLNAPDRTRAAFDDEGFFKTGDAMVPVDTGDWSRGLRFDGRIAEDFKLLTGTWVRAGQLRLDLLAVLAPLAADLVICGADRPEIGVLVIPDLAELARSGYTKHAQDGAMMDTRLLAALHKVLAARAAQVTGSAALVTRALVLAEPPSIAEGEITTKGNLSPRKVMARRKTLLERLYRDDDPAVVRI